MAQQLLCLVSHTLVGGGACTRSSFILSRESRTLGTGFKGSNHEWARDTVRIPAGSFPHHLTRQLEITLHLISLTSSAMQSHISLNKGTSMHTQILLKATTVATHPVPKSSCQGTQSPTQRHSLSLLRLCQTTEYTHSHARAFILISPTTMNRAPGSRLTSPRQRGHSLIYLTTPLMRQP